MGDRNNFFNGIKQNVKNIDGNLTEICIELEKKNIKNKRRNYLAKVITYQF